MFITPPDSDLTPVTVHVTSERYDIIDVPTPRNQYLAQMLMAIGGINESVEPGTYHFNVLDVEGQAVATLTPAPLPQ